MSKIRRKESVALPAEPRVSRIRRDPVRLEAKAVKAQPSREREIWTAAAGVVAIAACCTALVVGVSQVTSTGSSAAAAKPAGPRFGYCQTARDPDCVEDGDSFVMNGERIEIAGIDAAEIGGSDCVDEKRRGIEAAVRLRELLNGGTVAVTGAERAPDGRVASKVEVEGRDVGVTMLAGGFAREYRDGPRSWCSTAA